MTEDESGMAAVLARATRLHGHIELGRVYDKCRCGWYGSFMERDHLDPIRATALTEAGYGHVGQARAEALRKEADAWTEAAEYGGNYAEITPEYIAETLNAHADREAGDPR